MKVVSRQLALVATSSLYNCCRDILMLSRPQVLAMDAATTRCCRDLIFYGIVVATTFSFAGASVLLRHVLSEGGVATACSCRDLFSVQLLSRHPDVVATSSLSNGCRNNQVLSRPYLLWNCCRDNSLLLS